MCSPHCHVSIIISHLIYCMICIDLRSYITIVMTAEAWTMLCDLIIIYLVQNPAGCQWRLELHRSLQLPPVSVQPLNIFNGGRFRLGSEHLCNIRPKLSLWSILYPFYGLYLPHLEIRWERRHDICGPHIHLSEAYAFRNCSIIFHHKHGLQLISSPLNV